MDCINSISALIEYAIDKGLIAQEDSTWAVNLLLAVLHEESPDAFNSAKFPVEGKIADCPAVLLNALTDYAVSKGLIGNNISERDLFDTKLMGILTPPPREVRASFKALYIKDPAAATDWFYSLCKSTNYIRTDRIKKDVHWIYSGQYGELELSINLAKPEKDPRAIAAAGKAKAAGYPLCQLCVENEGYAGRIDHPARQNHRLIPVEIDGEDWMFQYSPYVYYNEHCIVLNRAHVPMKIDLSAFRKLLSFEKQFPHYFVGSNADLPIVGGSILSHEHFQGGRHEFPMAKAGCEIPLHFKGYDDIEAGILNWPMSVIRIACAESTRLTELADKILSVWREYTDEKAFIFSHTDGVPHNTLTPIARFRNGRYELDLVLRNNITTPEHPLGVFHPHANLHHIKKENIGLIEVMGLAILPGRLKREFELLRDAILTGADLRSNEVLAKHADWIDELKQSYTFNAANTDDILLKETGKVYEKVLEDAGVFKTDGAGREAFLRFIKSINS